MRYVLVLAASACLAAACSGSKPPTPVPKPGVGQVLAPATTAAQRTVGIGAGITVGALKINVAGPSSISFDGDGLDVTFDVFMTNTGTSGDVSGPASFGIRCDANRNGDVGDWWSTSTAGHNRRIPAGQSVDGRAVVAWLKWNDRVQCTGTTTIEADFGRSGVLAWIIPPSVVAKVNAVAAKS